MAREASAGRAELDVAALSHAQTVSASSEQVSMKRDALVVASEFGFRARLFKPQAADTSIAHQPPRSRLGLTQRTNVGNKLPLSAGLPELSLSW